MDKRNQGRSQQGTGCRCARSDRQDLSQCGWIEVCSQIKRCNKANGGCCAVAMAITTAGGYWPPCPKLSAASCQSRADVGKLQARRHAVTKQCDGVRSRSTAKQSVVVQRGQAFSRSTVSRTVPTRSAHCRGEPRLNCRQVHRRRAIADPKGSDSAWGAKPSAPKPQARETWSSLAGHRPRPACVQRVWLSGFPAPGVPRWKRGT
jgi:hypothetical protein